MEPSNQNIPAQTPPSSTPTGPQQPLAPVPTQASLSSKKKILKIIAIIVAILVAFFVIVSLVVNNATKDAVKVSDKLAAALIANRSSEIYALTSDAFRSGTSEAELKQVVEQLNSNFNGEAAKVTGKQIEKSTGQNAKAAVVYSIPAKDGKKLYLRVILEKNGNEWKVVNFRTSETSLEAQIE